MLFRRRRKRRMRGLVLQLVYLLVLLAGVLALWLFVPDEVKKVIYETYVNPP